MTPSALACMLVSLCAVPAAVQASTARGAALASTETGGNERRPGGSIRPPLELHGNVVLNDEVYLAVLDLPADFVPDARGAALVGEKLTRFLHRSGYELARVHTAVDGDHVRVDIDEGHIERLVITGQSSLRTIQLLLALTLPMNVFNRPYLERQLASVRAQTGMRPARFELVPTDRVEHVGPQVESLGAVVSDLGNYLGHPLVAPRAKYELHIAFARRDWPTGWGVDAALDGVDGFRVGTGYRGGDLLFARDRWFTAGRLGLKLRSRLLDNAAYPALQTARLQAGWYTPPLFSDLRPMLSLRAELASRQRPDVGIESYVLTREQVGAALAYEVFPGAELSVGMGLEERDVFRIRALDGTTPAPTVGPSSDLLAYAGLDARVVFDGGENIRIDRQHRLVIENRHYPGPARGFGVTTVDYRKVVPIGWHDVWIRAGGAWLWGDVPFVDEQQVGGAYVRGVFDSRFYARHVAGVRLEGRFSINRDVYKVGLFTDFAVFGDIDRTTDHETPRGIGSFGPSFHVLVADAFQLDIYYAIGFAGSHAADRGFAASLEQAF